MQIISSAAAIKQQTEQIRSSGKTIGLVPTMGALHEGHLQLLRTAAQENSVAVCSIFVNPTQFNNAEDFKLYPRLLEADAQLLKENNCQVLFAPAVAEMYTEALQLKFDFGALETVMEGQFRPGHFTGVAAVVSKLFHLIKPHKAYFGQKDLQQFAIINRLVTDLSFDLELVCHPIVREPDGLAMSSRNRRLAPDEREVATHLYKALQLAAQTLPHQSVPEVKTAVINYLAQYEPIRLEYFEIADALTLQPVSNLQSKRNTALCIAAYVGEVRLIDNLVIAG
ncbi:pantoate--beta-alanine ligase [Adhaeribacter rhizoryzae]|uniref:Pantothenate synthetase n=1 Tax=Adhaeribacter rhizoryzae TaxID=2607907 RepID=A0A5M6D4E6_9BACT|nr:pantoate--beta-alanine ligase [Adhaeribacter rhizoryzae]KAA5542388.1 pantoate--beta-alanine ligase [Adhaeribacter rhizoryzae]